MISMVLFCNLMNCVFLWKLFCFMCFVWFLFEMLCVVVSVSFSVSFVIDCVLVFGMLYMMIL